MKRGREEVQLRAATEEDLLEVLRWSRFDDIKDSESFHCNADSIIAAHSYHQLFVLSLQERAIAFFAYNGGFFGGVGLLFAVRAKYRSKGYGRQLASFMINRADPDSVIYLKAEAGAMPFWEKMGVVFPDYSRFNTLGYIVTEPRAVILPEGQRVSVRFDFFPEKKLYQATEPFYTSTVTGVRTSCDSILLQKRVWIGPQCKRGDFKDIVVSIAIDGTVFLPPTKAKRDHVRQMGITRGEFSLTYFSSGDFYIDQLIVPCTETHNADIEAACEFLMSGNDLTCPAACTDKQRLLSVISGTHQSVSAFLDDPACKWTAYGLHQLLPYTREAQITAMWSRNAMLNLKDERFGRRRNDTEGEFFLAMLDKFKCKTPEALLQDQQFAEQYPNCAAELKEWVENFDDVVLAYQRVHRGAMATMRTSIAPLKIALFEKGFDLSCTEQQEAKEYFEVLLSDNSPYPLSFCDDTYGIAVKNPCLPNLVHRIYATKIELIL